MKKETGILFAAGAGLFAALGLIFLRRFLNTKHKEYDEYYSDFHRHFDKNDHHEEHHGIEFLSLN